MADSVETALKVGTGKHDRAYRRKKKLISCFRQAMHALIAASACPNLRQKLFSFNSPQGACPDCHGIGFKLEIEEDLVVPEKDLTVAEGAIRPWASASHRVGRQSYFLDAPQRCF